MSQAMSSKQNDVKQYFFKLNRTLTGGLITILIIAALIFWYTKTLLLETSSSYIGAGFMLLAVLFYQLPYISFLLTRRHFANQDRAGIEILDSGWKTFKQWLDA